VESYFLGSSWQSDPNLVQQENQLNNYLSYLVAGDQNGAPFMDMLTKAGYKVGRGTMDSSYLDTSLAANVPVVDDSTIQSDLIQGIQNGTLKAPDANRLYTVFIQPGTVETRGTSSSLSDFLAYHDRFIYNGKPVWYAVMPYPGVATAGSYFSTTTTAFDSLTDVTSHEVAEAVTDPDYADLNRGWTDLTWNGGVQNNPPVGAEIGDICENLSNTHWGAGNWVSLNGYAVQLISNKSDKPMVPAELTVSDQGLSVNGYTVSGTIATGNDFTLLTHGTDLQATINWGDGQTSAGTVGDDGKGHFPVTASHTYSKGGIYSITITLQDKFNSIGYARDAKTVLVGPNLYVLNPLEIYPTPQIDPGVVLPWNEIIVGELSPGVLAGALSGPGLASTGSHVNGTDVLPVGLTENAGAVGDLWSAGMQRVATGSSTIAGIAQGTAPPMSGAVIRPALETGPLAADFDLLGRAFSPGGTL
jgi:hypothetical protein